jgi:hypothetical protein
MQTRVRVMGVLASVQGKVGLDQLHKIGTGEAREVYKRWRSCGP